MKKAAFSGSDGNFYNTFSKVVNYETLQASRVSLLCEQTCVTHAHSPTQAPFPSLDVTTVGERVLS